MTGKNITSPQAKKVDLGKRILLTGGTGMLGSELMLQLLREGHELTATYRSAHKIDFTRRQFELAGQSDESSFSRIRWEQCDLLDVVRLEEVMQGAEQVYHSAALVSFDTGDDQALIDNNVQTTANVVNCALDQKVEKLLHVSSVAALGRNQHGGYIDESSRWTGSKGNSAYARSKYQAELEVWRAYEEGLPVVVVNPSIIIGAGDWQTGSSALFGKIANGFKFYSEGINAYVDVRDVAAASIALMKAGITGERFVLMAENRSYREVFEMIADALEVKAPSIEAKPWMGALVWRLEKLRSLITGKRPMVTPDTVRTSFQENYYSNQKVKEFLGLEFRSLQDTVHYYARLFQRDHETNQ